MNDKIKELIKSAKKFDKEFQKRNKDVQLEEYELGTIRDIIKEAFSPAFNEAEIPEVLFNPQYKQIREVRINEYIASIDDDTAKSVLRKVFTGLTEVPLRQKIVSYIVLFCENGIIADFLEADKTRIFGPEVETIGSDDD